jgi:hypothetical protein
MERQRLSDFPYLRYGIPAGVIGAFVVAFFFLIVDFAAGRPLATPTALGAVLFRGEPFELSRSPDAALIVGYTAIHGTVFIAFASIAAGVLLGVGDRLGSALQRLLLLVGVLFLAATGIFYVFSALYGISALDGWRVLTANLLASLAMAVPLSRLQPRGEIELEPDAGDAGSAPTTNWRDGT